MVFLFLQIKNKHDLKKNQFSIDLNDIIIYCT